MWRPKLDILALETIDILSANWLERLFDEGEVHRVVRRMAKVKFPGPDDFSMESF